MPDAGEHQRDEASRMTVHEGLTDLQNMRREMLGTVLRGAIFMFGVLLAVAVLVFLLLWSLGLYGRLFH